MIFLSFLIPKAQVKILLLDIFLFVLIFFLKVPSLTGPEWFEGKTATVAKVSLDPVMLARERVQKPQETVEKTAKETAELSINSENQSSEKKTEDRTSESTMDENKTSKNETLEDSASGDKSFAVAKDSVASANRHPETPLPKEKDDTEEKSKPSGPSTSTTKVPSKYGSTGLSAYKYLSAKVYHPSTHFDDLRGLSINKSGDCDLIQVKKKKKKKAE